MGMKDKQTPSRCWEQGSSPCRMCVWLPATPALSAPTPELGDHGGPEQSNVPSWLFPMAGDHAGPPGQWDTISLMLSIVALPKFV